MATLRKVGIVTVNYRTPDLTAACLASLRQERDALPSLRVIIVDGGSADGSAEQLGKLIDQAEYRDWVEFLPLPINGGFGWANNQAIARLLAKADAPAYLLMLNPDSEIEAGAVRYLADYLDNHPHVGAVGSQLFEIDSSRAGSAFNFPTVRGELARGAGTGLIERWLNVPPVSVQLDNAREVDWVTGASVMLRREALEETGLFDEGFFLYHEEVELMWRLRRAGWSIATEPQSKVMHVGGAATGMRSGASVKQIRPRRPPYWYRSRARYFGLTRGYSGSLAAFVAWLLGHGIWRIRKTIGLAPNAKPVDHEIRDFLRYSRPRRVDCIPAYPSAFAPPTDAPTWMGQE